LLDLDGLPHVRVLYVLYDGSLEEYTVPAPVAVQMLMAMPQLGDWQNHGGVRRARILWCEVDARAWDMSV